MYLLPHCVFSRDKAQFAPSNNLLNNTFFWLSSCPTSILYFYINIPRIISQINYLHLSPLLILSTFMEGASLLSSHTVLWPYSEHLSQNIVFHKECKLNEAKGLICFLWDVSLLSSSFPSSEMLLPHISAWLAPVLPEVKCSSSEGLQYALLRHRCSVFPRGMTVSFSTGRLTEPWGEIKQWKVTVNIRRRAYRSISETLSEEEHLTSGSTGTGHADIWGKSIPEDGKSVRKSSEMEICLTHSRISLEAYG